MKDNRLIHCINGFVKPFFELLFPNKCICCDEIIDEGEFVCELCTKRLEFINSEKYCPVCGNEKDRCICGFRVYHFERSLAVFEYIGYARKALHLYKIYRHKECAVFFVRHMSLAFLREYRGIDFKAICCVPTKLSSRRKRGFDHSALLGEGLGKLLGIPVEDDVLLCKNKSRSQHGNDFEDRLKNIKGKYSFSRYIPSGNYLLVDDVKTTGATLDECARQLLLAGADKVYVLTALAAMPKKKNDKRPLKKKKA